MSKKVISLFMFVAFFSSYHSAYAGLIINEVMYDLSGADSTSGKSKEWIEIYNPDAGAVSIDASKWRIYDGSANRTINGEVDFSIPANSYVIFAGDKDTFLSDHSGFSGIVYDTGITSLNNTGVTFKILDQDGNTVDSLTYASSQGGAGDGNSLQKISGSWAGAVPTPGVANETTTTPPPAATQNTTSGGGGGSSASGGSSGATKPVEIQKIKTKISAKTSAFAGLPLIFQASATGHSGEILYYGKYFWNFGDGDSLEVKMNGANNTQKFPHTYFYPGDYAVSMEYYMNPYGDVPDALAQITIRVVSADILISAVGDEKDFFVELSNTTEYPVDISNWILSSSMKSFIFPKNTFINSEKKMIISSNLTLFSILDKDTLKLMTPQGQIIFDYPTSILVVAPAVPVKVAARPKAPIIAVQPKESVESISEEEISFENLKASVIESDVIKEKSYSYIPALAFLFIGASAGVVYFVRRRGSPFKAGDDFKILDE